MYVHAHAALDLSQTPKDPCTKTRLQQNDTKMQCNANSRAAKCGRPRAVKCRTASNIGHTRKIGNAESDLSKGRVPLTTSRWQKGKVVGQRKDEWFQDKNGEKNQSSSTQSSRHMSWFTSSCHRSPAACAKISTRCLWATSKAGSTEWAATS